MNSKDAVYFAMLFTLQAFALRFIVCDLSNQKQVRELAEKIKKITSCVDILVNSAGANYDAFRLSADNIEMTFTTSHLSHFLLTALLLELISKSSDARIINVSGKYFYQRKAKESSPVSKNKAARQKLWDLSVRLSSIDESIGNAWWYFRP